MSTSPQPAFHTIVDALLDPHDPLPKKYLAFFSDIDSASLTLLLDAWPRIIPQRKRALLESLESQLEEDSVSSFDDLARALLADPEAFVRAAAMRLLVESEDARLLPLYEKTLATDDDPAARAEAAHAMGLFIELGELEEIPENIYHKAEDALLAAIKDPAAQVRRRALESLGYSSRPEVAVLIEETFAHNDRESLASALVAMGRSNEERWDAQVLRSLANDHPSVRLAAAVAAGELALNSARIPLMGLLEEEDDPDVFSAAIWSLSQIGGEDVKTFLENLLDKTEGDDEIEFLEDALANLAFTEDLERFDMLSLDPDDDLDEDK